MATVQTMNGTKLLVQIGDGGSPEVFTHDCLINAERGIAFSSDVAEFVVPDCDAPDEPAWKETTKDGLGASVTGGGMLHTASVETWFNWFKDDATKTCRIKIDVTGANGGGYWEGEFHLTEFEITGNRNEKATVSVTLVASGALTWTDNA